MGLDRTLQVRPGNFSGNSKVYSAGPEGLAAHVRNLQAVQASAAAIAGAADDFAADDTATIDSVPLVTFDASGGDNEDQVTLVNAELGVPTGHPITFGPSGGDIALPLLIGTEYFVIRLQGSGQAGLKDVHAFQVAATQLQAEQGVAIEFDDDGSGAVGVAFHIALPNAPVSADLSGGTLGVLGSQVLATTDTIMEGLGSLMRTTNALRADIGMEQPDDGTLTSALTPILVDVVATANTNDDDAASFESVVANYNDMNNAFVTMINNINDICAAVGLDEYTDSMSPHLGVENANGAIDSPAAGVIATDSADATVVLIEFNKALVVWGAALGHLLARVDVVSDGDFTSDSDYAEFLLPAATEIPQVLSGLRTRQR